MLQPDLIVVGGGPAGLSAAASAASDGLRTLLIEGTDRLGGQAGKSHSIENFIGFPEGITGEELTARAVAQCAKFRVAVSAPTTALAVTRDDDMLAVTTEDGVVRARAVILSPGLHYRKLDADNVALFLGRGVHYGTPGVSFSCHGERVAIIGAGNSAGQAALYCARTADQVDILVRGASLDASMSAYLIDRIAGTPNITVRTHTSPVAFDGDTRLRSVTLSTGETLALDSAYIFIGADPRTGWLKGTLELDAHGFILTGHDLAVPRPALSTSLDGVFAVGDVRSGSVKRVASAVGEGASAVKGVHDFLAQIPLTA